MALQQRSFDYCLYKLGAAPLLSHLHLVDRKLKLWEARIGKHWHHYDRSRMGAKRPKRANCFRMQAAKQSPPHFH